MERYKVGIPLGRGPAAWRVLLHWVLAAGVCNELAHGCHNCNARTKTKRKENKSSVAATKAEWME